MQAFYGHGHGHGLERHNRCESNLVLLAINQHFMMKIDEMVRAGTSINI